MKYFATLIIILASFIGRAQTNSTNILGTWELAEFKYGDNPSSVPETSNFKRYKIFTPTNYVVIDIDTKTNVTRTSIFGTYTLVDGRYTENVLHVNKESIGMIGKEFSFVVKFENDETISQVGKFNDMKTDEKWRRVKIKALERQ